MELLLGNLVKYVRNISVLYIEKHLLLEEEDIFKNVDNRKDLIIREYTDEKSIRGAARSANVSPPTALKQIKEVSNELHDVIRAYKESIKDEDPASHKYYRVLNCGFESGDRILQYQLVG